MSQEEFSYESGELIDQEFIDMSGYENNIRSMADEEYIPETEISTEALPKKLGECTCNALDLKVEDFWIPKNKKRKSNPPKRFKDEKFAIIEGEIIY